MKPFQLRDKKTGILRHGGQWLIRYKAPGGTWRRQVAGATEKEAARVLRGIETDIERGLWKDPRNERAESRQGNECRTFGDIVEQYKAYYHDRSACSRQNLVCAVLWLTRVHKGIAPPLPTSTFIVDLTPARMRKVYDILSSSPYAVASRNLVLTYLKMICRWAWKHPAIPLEQNPAADLVRFKAAGTRGGDGFVNPVSRAEVFTCGEARAIVETAEVEGPEVLAVMLRTAFSTGLRKGELCGLLWSCIDFERRLILVSRNYDRRGTKSGKDRVVPMPVELTARLRKWKAASPWSQDNDPVFASNSGKNRTVKFNWSNYVRLTASTAGVLRPGMTRLGHGTRHYYATQWLLNGGSAEMLARILGHSDTSLICQVYSHFQDADFVSAVDRLSLSLEANEKPVSVVAING